MKTKNLAWSFNKNDLFVQMNLSPEEKEVLEPETEFFIGALLERYQNCETEVFEKETDTLVANKALLLPGKRYHLNLSAVAKETLLNALGIIANAFILNNSKLLDLTVIISVGGVIQLLNKIEKLDENERKIVDAILQLKKSSKSRPYWPKAEEIADKLKVTPDEIKEILPILSKKNIVQFESKGKKWRVCF